MYPLRHYPLCGVAVVLLLLAGVDLPAFPAQPKPDAASKVDPPAWEDTTNGAKAHFLILLNEQGDSKTIARQATDRKAKRRSVTANLSETAARSQAGIVQLLRAHNAKHRPYWVVNMIAAEGPRGIVEALAKSDRV